MFKIRRRKNIEARKSVRIEDFNEAHAALVRGILNTTRFIPLYQREVEQFKSHLSGEELIIIGPLLHLTLNPTFPELVTHAENHGLITHQEALDLLSGKAVEIKVSPMETTH
ncbi:MAG: hypothetical protein HOP00_01560 [Nitrospira sp.]|nr:hypothetical protein [Nitrospira sp.]